MIDNFENLSRKILGNIDGNYSNNTRIENLSKIYKEKNIRKILIMGLNPAGDDSSYDKKFIGYIPDLPKSYDKLVYKYKNLFNTGYFKTNYNLFSEIIPRPKMTWGIDEKVKKELGKELLENCDETFVNNVIEGILENEEDETPRLIFGDLIYYHKTNSQYIKKVVNKQYKNNTEDLKKNIFKMLDKHIEMFNPSMIIVTNAYASNLIYSFVKKKDFLNGELKGEDVTEDMIKYKNIPIIFSGMVSRGNMDNYSYFRLKNRIKEIYDDVKNN